MRVKVLLQSLLVLTALAAVAYAQGIRIEPGILRVVAANVRGLQVHRASADAGVQICSNGGSGTCWGIVAETGGNFRVQHDSDADPVIEIAPGGSIRLGASTGVSNTNFYRSATAQPGSAAWNTADDTGLTSGAIIDFDTEDYDDAGNFASDTFTAPVAGRYRLEASINVVNTAGAGADIGAYFQTTAKPNGIWFGLESGVPNGAQRIFAGSTTTVLAQGDTATVRLYTTGGSATVKGNGTALLLTRFEVRLQP